MLAVVFLTAESTSVSCAPLMLSVNCRMEIHAPFAVLCSDDIPLMPYMGSVYYGTSPDVHIT